MPSADEGVHCLPCHQIWGICTWPWVTHPWCLQWPTAPLKMDPMPITSSGAWEFVSDKMTSDCILSKSRCLSAVGNQQDLPETCLIPLGSLQWDGSHFEGAFPASRQCEWLFQAFWFHTESACHRIQATWHNRGWGGGLSLCLLLSGSARVIRLPSVGPHYLYHGELTTTSLHSCYRLE